MNMDQNEFSFEEELLTEVPDTQIMYASAFLDQAEGLDKDALEMLFAKLAAEGVILDLSDLPRLGATGQAALRLREEMELAQRSDLLSGLEPGDALRLYLEELAWERLPKDPEVEKAALAQANAKGQTEKAMASPLLITGMNRAVEIAKEYTGYGVLLLDLIQEGNMGLWQCMTAYTGGSFEQLIDTGIRQAMIRAILRQTIASGLSRKLRQAVEDYRSADERLLTELGRNPTPEEMAEHLHMTVEEVENVRKTLENARMVDKAHVQPEPEEEDAEDALAVEDTAYYQTRERVSDLRSGLTELETEVLNLRYGLNGKQPLSLQEAARRLNLTTAQITKIEQTALEKMRAGQ